LTTRLEQIIGYLLSDIALPFAKGADSFCQLGILSTTKKPFA